MSQPVVVTPRTAAVIVLVRELAARQGIEVYMVRRHVRSEFAPDVFVFPGGSVRAEDAAVERAPGLCAPVALGVTTLGAGFRVAALRECFEESGVLLAWRDGQMLTLGAADSARFAEYRAALRSTRMTLGEVARQEGLVLATDALLHWAHWITPERLPLRFDTHFFLATMPAGQQPLHDAIEVVAGEWIAPRAALRRFEEGTFPLIFATAEQLRALADVPTMAEAHARFAGSTPRTIMPRVIERDGSQAIVLPDAE